MGLQEKKREFILSYLTTLTHQINLKTVQKLIDFGKNNNYTPPEILQELSQMDAAHEKILTATFELDFIYGTKLFNHDATQWLSPQGGTYLKKLQRQESANRQRELDLDRPAKADDIYDQYLRQMLGYRAKMANKTDQLTLQEFAIDLRHLLIASKKIEAGALSKFQPFLERNYASLAQPLTPVLAELAKRFMVNRDYEA